MALIEAHSFDSQDSDRFLLGGTLYVNGRNGKALSAGKSVETVWSYVFTMTGNTVYCGFAFKPTINNADTGLLFGLYEALGFAQVSLQGEEGVGWQLTPRGGTPIIGGSYQVGTWYWVEFTTTFSASGYAELRINGNTIGTYSGAVHATVPTHWRIVNTGNWATGYYDDFVLMDGSGSQMNGFTGDVKVHYQLPNGDSAIDLAGSDGNSVNNYQLVNEPTPSTSEYVGGSTAGDRDYYSIGSLSASTGGTFEIFGVQVSGTMGKEAGGSAYGGLLARENGSTTEDNLIGLSTTFTWERFPLDVAPDASTWTQAKVNNLEVGFQVSTST
jgi:hypothetical protein